MNITLYFTDETINRLENVSMFNIDDFTHKIHAVEKSSNLTTAHWYDIDKVSHIHLGRLDNERSGNDKCGM